MSVRVGREFMAAQPNPSIISLRFVPPPEAGLQLAAGVPYGHDISYVSHTLLAVQSPTTSPLPSSFASLKTNIDMGASTLLGYMECP